VNLAVAFGGLLAIGCTGETTGSGKPRADGGPLTETGAMPDGGSLTEGGITEAGTPGVGKVVISQVYGGGGGTDAMLTHDFVELFNQGTVPISLSGWSLQYASATGTGNFGATDTQLAPLPDVSLATGQYFLLQLAQGTAGTTALPTPDFVDPTPINMSATAGKIALVYGGDANRRRRLDGLRWGELLRRACARAGAVEHDGTLARRKRVPRYG
jgi:hypothetical protein